MWRRVIIYERMEEFNLFDCLGETIQFSRWKRRFETL
jgi:hypothetical protein